MDRAAIVADFEDELRLDQVNTVASAAGDTGRTQLGHPGVVEAARAERSLDQVAGGRHARSGLAGMDGKADVARGQVDAQRWRGFSEPDRVRGRRAKDGCAQLEHGPESLFGSHRATGYGQHAEALGARERRPETDEGTKGEGEEDPIVRLHARRSVDVVGPDPDPPVPGLGGVEPAPRRRATGTRGLMQPAVAVDWEGEVGAKRRIGLLVGRDLSFRCERQSLEVGPGADRVEPRLVEAIALEQGVDAGAEALELRPHPALPRRGRGF